MRPAVIYVEKDGTLDITKERRDYLLREAYEQGYADGKASNSLTTPYRMNWEITNKTNTGSFQEADVFKTSINTLR